MSAHKSKKRRPRIQRVTSNVFAMFSQDEIHQFKEAFNMIDQNKDGYIDKEDLLDMLTSLGKDPSDDALDEMINDRHGPLNFTMFLTLFGEKLTGTDPELVINNAFACFDTNNSGYVNEEYLREMMTTTGERWSQQTLDELFYKAPISDGCLNYKRFTKVLKHGTADDDDATSPRTDNDATAVKTLNDPAGSKTEKDKLKTDNISTGLS